jgi:hypothetical protein
MTSDKQEANEPPKLSSIDYTILVLKIQRRIQDLIGEGREGVLGISCDWSGDFDILVRLLDEMLISEREFEGIPNLVLVGKSRL